MSAWLFCSPGSLSDTGMHLGDELYSGPRTVLTASSSTQLLAQLAAVQVLSVADGNKDLIRADPLPRMHTMHNLAEILATWPPGLAHTLRDDSLASDAKAIAEVSLLGHWNSVAVQLHLTGNTRGAVGAACDLLWSGGIRLVLLASC